MTPKCEECGTELQQATIDVAETPDVDPEQDHARAEFDAQHMVAVGFCPNPDCPRYRQPGTAEDAGARL
jgi:hypothetical protein